MKADIRAIDLLIAERSRQIANEGYSAEHDDIHIHGELAIAAAVYATPDEDRAYKGIVRRADAVPVDWPWPPIFWKPTPKNRIRELVKAGALIIAEIERLQREATQ